MIKPGVLFIISAPSGAGKTSLTAALIAKLKPEYPIDRVVTYTSRAARSGEIDGVDYHFMQSQEFENKIKEDFFLEWSTAYNAYYGSPSSIIKDLEQGNHRILIIDRVGTQHVIKKMRGLPYKIITIWITIPSIELLQGRLQARAQDNQEQMARRLALATQELKEEGQNPIFGHHIMNDFFENSLKKLEDLAKNFF